MADVASIPEVGPTSNPPTLYPLALPWSDGADPLQHRSDRLPDHQHLINNILYDHSSSQQPSSLLDKLPAELLHQILSHLPAADLACVSSTCRVLAEHGSNDLLWAELVNSNLSHRIHDPGPFPSFRRLFLAHYPYWFLPRNKIWFADNEHTGTLILARYDNRRGVIEAYRLVAERREPMFHIWESNPDVIIQSFTPKVSLWLDDPVLLLRDADPTSSVAEWQSDPTKRRTPIALESQRIFCSFSFCDKQSSSQHNLSPDQLWPPPIIPSDYRAQRDVKNQKVENPQRFSDISDKAFRMKRWATFSRMQMNILLSPGHQERLLTYGTLDPKLYTPTKQKPYQGIWVGDYSAHGCEFLLFLQRDPPASSLPRETLAADGAEEHETSETDASGIVHQGGLEAIKLTGDPNVPRGEITFVAEDIGPRGLVRIAEDEPYKSARIVRCLGHVAGIGFRDDTFITSQLILISTDYMAHYWEEMGHISYFRRVDIDALMQT
ncbi:hypothetical protein N7474_010018 [Penicillium riverlandense]|uniref:uncharacterized protein n=1 Tax=Penicillium riverlandense TaxID=1903569 RepID=UPI002549849B|nr:uncharacterized protein N7474_010018 [Penicillium riverlandense]KAJ5808749.1 hypothetical protein N7474_010018 [Penicillium riverlandense]